ncbi:NAD(P)H-binding protein [Maritimibacter sp. DP1N21-5]|uniref:NmrA family NAD(P)-binding protein n=1 Tax=Maritimibacter sp. DP1N21-5 TaxID=2836867 RepID=UPI001C46250B|nr:NAD(P)H-binding protein [Maritimibacter sp. DP1N21-5]MBV7407472.1 NAD(P)H-binding protein [Maritimibacter sp. DP1N21-5]
MIVISGASGHVGGEAARILSESGVETRLLVRDPSKVAHLKPTEVVRTGYLDPQLVEAFNPGDRVFMVSVYETYDIRLEMHRAFVKAAADRGVAQLAYLSYINCAPDAEFEHATSHWETEKMIRESGVPFTILRTGLYQSSAEAFYNDEGLCRAPAGEGRVSWVSRRDIGSAVAAVLRTPGHEGKVYDLTGPEALTMQETTDRINDLLNLSLRFEDVDDYENLCLKGLPDPVGMKKTRRSAFTSMALGEQELVTDDIATLTGIKAAPIDRHVLQYPERFGWSSS